MQSASAMRTPDDPPTSTAAPDPGASYSRRLLHRWLVEYNPLYLLSAALVQGGMWVCSSGLAAEGSQNGPLAVAGITELYAACLIGGAALLTRIGQRRPAVLLALITLLYQWDLTLHTERGPYLAAWASGAWLVIFALKIVALAWAMKVRLSGTAAVTLLLAGFGLAAFPAYLQLLGPHQAGSLIAAWGFALVSLRRTSAITSLTPLDGWGSTVLRRTAFATWILSALLVTGHVLFWSSQSPISFAPILVVAPLLLVRGLRRESHVWATVVGTLVLTGVASPASFSLTAIVAAAALGLRALAPAPLVERSVAATRSVPPYRSVASGEAPEIVEVEVPAPVDRAAMTRLLAGAAFGAYLSVWTLGWSGGPWPAHVAALDLVLTAAAIVAVWRARARIALAPLVATYAHLVIAARLLPTPRSPLGWGASAVGLGFALLLGSLVASYTLRTRER